MADEFFHGEYVRTLMKLEDCNSIMASIWIRVASPEINCIQFVSQRIMNDGVNGFLHAFVGMTVSDILGCSLSEYSSGRDA